MQYYKKSQLQINKDLANGIIRVAQKILNRGFETLKIHWATIGLIGLTLIAFLLRIFGLNWDQGTFQHPDERWIIYVTECIGITTLGEGCWLPDNLADPAHPANPHFFAYGSFPIYLLAFLSRQMAHIFAYVQTLPTDGGKFDDPVHMLLIGRTLSALFNAATVPITGLIAQRLVGRGWDIFAAACFTFTTLAVQLSHFYAFDTLLTFFVTLVLFFAICLAFPLEQSDPNVSRLSLWPIIRLACLIGFSFGLAITSKVSAVPLAVPITLAFLLRWKHLGWHYWVPIVLGLFVTIITTVITIALTMPYIFLDRVHFWEDVNLQNRLATGQTVQSWMYQFEGTTPYLFQIKNIFVWNMGIPLALLCFSGIIFVGFWLIRWKKWDDPLLIPLSWIMIYFGITGRFFMKFSRYQLPIYPMLIVMGTILLAAIYRNKSRLNDTQSNDIQGKYARGLGHGFVKAHQIIQRYRRYIAVGIATIVICSSILMTLAYLNIYTQPITRIQASNWIYAHIPKGSIITKDEGDDCLPLDTSQYIACENSSAAIPIALMIYSPDTPEKSQMLARQLEYVDVIAISSNLPRYAIFRMPDKYPLMVHYYNLLFSGKLGFKLAVKFENHPHLGPFNLDDTDAEQNFSVFDHPSVWIFMRNDGPRMTSVQIQQELLNGVIFP
jgi:hypothetical protein